MANTRTSWAPCTQILFLFYIKYEAAVFPISDCETFCKRFSLDSSSIICLPMCTDILIDALRIFILLSFQIIWMRYFSFQFIEKWKKKKNGNWIYIFGFVLNWIFFFFSISFFCCNWENPFVSFDNFYSCYNIFKRICGGSRFYVFVKICACTKHFSGYHSNRCHRRNGALINLAWDIFFCSDKYLEVKSSPAWKIWDKD